MEDSMSDPFVVLHLVVLVLFSGPVHTGPHRFYKILEASSASSERSPFSKLMWA